jgi:hypothetical protein
VSEVTGWTLENRPLAQLCAWGPRTVITARPTRLPRLHGVAASRRASWNHPCPTKYRKALYNSDFVDSIIARHRGAISLQPAGGSQRMPGSWSRAEGIGENPLRHVLTAIWHTHPRAAWTRGMGPRHLTTILVATSDSDVNVIYLRGGAVIPRCQPRGRCRGA